MSMAYICWSKNIGGKVDIRRPFIQICTSVIYFSMASLIINFANESYLSYFRFDDGHRQEIVCLFQGGYKEHITGEYKIIFVSLISKKK